MIRKQIASRWISSGVIFVLGLGIAADITLVLRLKATGQHGQPQNTEIQDAEIMYRHGANDASSFDVKDADPLNQFAQKLVQIPPPEGFTAKGIKTGIVPGKQTGWAVRYISNQCGYCDQDNAIWNRLAGELQHLGYQVITVTPSASEVYPDDKVVPRGTPQEAYVSMEWVKRFQLTVTPTLLIFSPDQRLTWAREGMLHPNDIGSALRTVETAGHKIE